jgi:hypothetical protein
MGTSFRAMVAKIKGLPLVSSEDGTLAFAAPFQPNLAGRPGHGMIGCLHTSIVQSTGHITLT